MTRKTLTIFIMLLFIMLPVKNAYAFQTATANDLYLTAEAAIAIDYETGQVIFEKNADQMLVPASLTKNMTAYIIYEELEAGNLTFDTPITISANAAAISRNTGYPQAVALESGGTLTVDTLLKLILVPSASASCIVMAEHISGTEALFVERMNETAKRLGMEANYENSHGAKVHYVTARSQAILVREFISRFPDILRYTSISSMTFNGKYYNNTNRFLTISPYYGVDGFKSGNITEAKYCLASTIEENGHRIIAITLKSDTVANCYVDSRKLLEFSIAKLKTESPIYNYIGNHADRVEIEDFYRTGFSPLPLDSNYYADSVVWGGVLIDTLKNITDYYGIRTENKRELFKDETLTKEKAMALINEFVPFMGKDVIPFSDYDTISPYYVNSVNRLVSGNILPYHLKNPQAAFSPQEDFTYAMFATAINNLIPYIESNMHWITTDNEIVNAPEVITLETPINLDIPFDFDAYTDSSVDSEFIRRYDARNVTLLSIRRGDWWEVDIDGRSEWICTNGKLVYCNTVQPLYDNYIDFNIINIIEPQIVKVVSEGYGYYKISTAYGNCLINSDQAFR